MPVAPEHLVPELLSRQRILAHQERLELGDDDARRLRVNWPVTAFQSLVGLDLEIVRADGAQFHMARTGLVVFLGPVLVIDVERVDLPLVVDAHQFLRMALNSPDLNGGDLQRALRTLPHPLAGFGLLCGTLRGGVQRPWPGKSCAGSHSRAHVTEKRTPFHGREF